jgi:hypothetical protein
MNSPLIHYASIPNPSHPTAERPGDRVQHIGRNISRRHRFDTGIRAADASSRVIPLTATASRRVSLSDGAEKTDKVRQVRVQRPAALPQSYVGNDRAITFPQ